MDTASPDCSLRQWKPSNDMKSTGANLASISFLAVAYFFCCFSVSSIHTASTSPSNSVGSHCSVVPFICLAANFESLALLVGDTKKLDETVERTRLLMTISPQAPVKSESGEVKQLKEQISELTEQVATLTTQCLAPQ